MPVILAYHNVIPDEIFDDALHLQWSHRLSTFKKHVSILQKYFEITCDFPGLKRGQAIITFDDGFENNIRTSKILEQAGARGAFFIPMAPLQSAETLIIDQIAMWFSYVPAGKYRLRPGIFEIHSPEQLNRMQAFQAFFKSITDCPELWYTAPDELNQAYPFAKLALSDQMLQARFRPMSLSAIAGLKEQGHLVGCHSWDHRPLASLTDNDLERDFERAWEMAQKICNTLVFCYPFGGVHQVDGRVVRTAEKVGFSHGLVLHHEWPFHQRDNPLFTIPRISLPENFAPYLVHARLSGFEFFAHRLWQRLRSVI